MTSEDYIIGIRSGNTSVLSRAITLVESQQEKHQQLAQEVIGKLMDFTGNSFRLGVTGVPGVGKSTFIESFGKIAVEEGHKLAVLAIDPSSNISKGSILGDKTRMEQLSVLPNVYIRPSPSSGTLGGVTRVTYETILLCEAAGFDYVIVETVGVGQSEMAVSRITDFFLLLMLAGAGDELQGIKRGIMEMADGLVITKADGDNLLKANAARSEYAHAMHLLQAPESGWTPRAMVCSGLHQLGIREVYQMIEEYRNFSKANHYFKKRRKQQQYDLFLSSVEEQLRLRFFNNKNIQHKLNEIRNMETIHPFSLARKLLDSGLKDTE